GEDVTRRARLYSLAPINEMVRRHWIKGSDSPDTLEKQLKDFWEVQSLEEKPHFVFAARMSTSYSEMTPAQLTWMCRVKKLGRAVGATKFNSKAFADHLPKLRQLIASEHDVRRVPRFLAQLGVRLVAVEYIPKTKIDGATVWLEDGSPVVGISFR